MGAAPHSGRDRHPATGPSKRKTPERAPELTPEQARRVLDEPHTDELEERLRRSASPEAYIRNLPATDLDIPEYLAALITSHQVRKPDVVHRCGFDQTHCYQIFQGKRGADRNRVIMLALAFPLSLQETQRLLSRFGHARLWSKDPRDAVIIFGIEHGQSLMDVDGELSRLHYDTLAKA